jgi:hypothetical protein
MPSLPQTGPSAASADPRSAAIAYVDAHPAHARAVGREAWISAIEQHLTPSPGGLWKVRARRHATVPVAQLVERVIARLQPPAGTRPQPVCEHWCWEQHGLESDVA